MKIKSDRCWYSRKLKAYLSCVTSHRICINRIAIFLPCLQFIILLLKIFDFEKKKKNCTVCNEARDFISFSNNKNVGLHWIIRIDIIFRKLFHIRF